MKGNFSSFDKPLIVLELANNHQGDLAHGLNIIEQFGTASKKYFDEFNFALKFQYRNLDTFIHKDYVDSDIKYVKRFLETKLEPDEWIALIDKVKELSLYTMCTPFDEPSVDKVINPPAVPPLILSDPLPWMVNCAVSNVLL